MDLNEIKEQIKETLSITEDTNKVYTDYIKGKNYTETGLYNQINITLNALMSSSFVNCVIIKGESGIGKSENVNHYLKDNIKDFKIVSGFITQASLFDFLRQNSNKVIVFRDTDVLTKNLNILKGMTEYPYIVTRTTKHQTNNTFTFSGKIIIELNEFPKMNIDLNALIKRVMLLDLYIPKEEMLNIIRNSAKDKAFCEEYIKMANIPHLREFKRIEENPELLLTFQKIVTPERKYLLSLIGTEWIKPTKLKEVLLLEGYIRSLRNAERKIEEWLIVELLENEGLAERNDRVRVKQATD